MIIQSWWLAWLSSGLVFLIILSVLAVLFRRRIRTSPVWYATVTPLASIIGSGFLICAPLLMVTAGIWAPIVILGIVVVAYALGSSIRFNILYIEHKIIMGSAPRAVMSVEALSRPVLGIAYIISVAFYLKLLSVFVLRSLTIHSAILENVLTTIVIVIIGLSGKIRGLSLLELQEMYLVNFKLAVIIALVAGLVVYNGSYFWANQHFLFNLSVSHEPLQRAFREILGTLLIVQGFETSRYLGSAYSPAMRVRTMRYAQLISGVIYVAFITLSMTLLRNVHTISETLIIQLSKEVAIVLPFLVIIAGIMSQFSAAIADTIGSAGLLSEATHRKLTRRNGYLLITTLVIILTWLTDVYDVIAIASKAFAVYYVLQLLISLMAIKGCSILHLLRVVLYCFLIILMLLVVMMGVPVG